MRDLLFCPFTNFPDEGEDGREMEGHESAVVFMYDLGEQQFVAHSPWLTLSLALCCCQCTYFHLFMSHTSYPLPS